MTKDDTESAAQIKKIGFWIAFYAVCIITGGVGIGGSIWVINNV